jgi:phosphatidylglycerophosphatase A
VLVATVGGAGYAPVAPGTVASALTVLVLWLVPFSRAGLLLFLAVVVVLGTWAAHHAEAALGGKDPGAIVIDEVAGMALSVLVFPLTVPVLVTAFSSSASSTSSSPSPRAARSASAAAWA